MHWLSPRGPLQPGLEAILTSFSDERKECSHHEHPVCMHVILNCQFLTIHLSDSDFPDVDVTADTTLWDIWVLYLENLRMRTYWISMMDPLQKQSLVKTLESTLKTHNRPDNEEERKERTDSFRSKRDKRKKKQKLRKYDVPGDFNSSYGGHL